jgi:hypothetical protein
MGAYAMAKNAAPPSGLVTVFENGIEARATNLRAKESQPSTPSIVGGPSTPD